MITGGRSGIGLATAKLFQEVDARVAISGRNQQSLDAAVKELGSGVLAVRSDVGKLGDLEMLFEVVTTKLDRIDADPELRSIQERFPGDPASEAAPDSTAALHRPDGSTTGTDQSERHIRPPLSFMLVPPHTSQPVL